MSRSTDFLEALNFIDTAGKHIINPKGVEGSLESQMSMLKSILDKKRLGCGSQLQNPSGSEVTPLDGERASLNMPNPGKTSAASQFVQKAASEGFVYESFETGIVRQNMATKELFQKTEEGTWIPATPKVKKAYKEGKVTLQPWTGRGGPFEYYLYQYNSASEGFVYEGKLGEPYKVDAEEHAVAQKHLKKGYKYFVKVPEDDRILYFRRVQDVGPFMRDNYPNSTMEATGYIKDMVEE